jgi:pimeloyl-ACP methyl ester carboxylesterase
MALRGLRAYLGRMPAFQAHSSRTFVGPEGVSHVAMFGDERLPPAVLLHSGGLSGKQWRRAVTELRDRFFVVVPDALGMGDSPPWPSDVPFHFEQEITQSAALVASLTAPAALVGHSYGGLVALRVAAAAPQHVSRLCLYEPAVFGVLAAAADPAFEDVLALSERHKGTPRDAPGWPVGWLRSFVDFWNSPGAWDGLSREARTDYLRVHHKLEREVDTLLADRTPAAAYATVHQPTLLMAGERSPRAARRVVDALFAAMPSARLEVFAQAGHLGPLTHARRVAARIAAHLCGAPDSRAWEPAKKPAPRP